LVRVSHLLLVIYKLTLYLLAFVEEREEYVKDFERINDRLLRQFKQQHYKNHQVQAKYLQMQRKASCYLIRCDFLLTTLQVVWSF